MTMMMMAMVMIILGAKCSLMCASQPSNLFPLGLIQNAVYGDVESLALCFHLILLRLLCLTPNALKLMMPRRFYQSD